jgi:MFS family permease
MPEADFLAWGWRVPFLISLLLVFVGLIIRVRILETPAFSKVKESGQEARQPILEVLRMYPKEVLLAMGARLAENGAFYIYTNFVYVYATLHVHMDRNVVLVALIIAATIELAAIPMYGALSDRIGRRPVYLFGAVFTAILAYPLFWALDANSVPLIRLALLASLILCHAAMYAPQAAFFAELFGTRVRYSGASLGVQLSSAIAGGLSPIIAVRLLQDGYGRGALSLYLIGMSVITIVSVYLATETVHHDIERSENVPKVKNVPGVSQ